VQDIQISTKSSRGLYQYTLVGTEAATVSEWSKRLTERLARDPRLVDVSSEAQEGGLRAMINIDREKAGRLGVSMQNVVDALSDAFGQRQISTIYAQNNQYRVILEASPQCQRDPGVFSKLYLPASGVGVSSTNTQASLTSTIQPTLTTQSANPSAQVPLSAIASFERSTAPLVIIHQEQFPAVTISFNLAPGAALGDAVEAIAAAQSDIGMPASVTGTYSGDAAEFSKSLGNEAWLILAAAVTIYIVLGVLYESFIHPFT